MYRHLSFDRSCHFVCIAQFVFHCCFGRFCLLSAQCSDSWLFHYKMQVFCSSMCWNGKLKQVYRQEKFTLSICGCLRHFKVVLFDCWVSEACSRGFCRFLKPNLGVKLNQGIISPRNFHQIPWIFQHLLKCAKKFVKIWQKPLSKTDLESTLSDIQKHDPCISKFK